jgi:hypothetical protein
LDKPRPCSLRSRGETLLFKHGSCFIGNEPAQGRGELREAILPNIKDERDLKGVITIMDVVLIGTVSGDRLAGATISDLENLTAARRRAGNQDDAPRTRGQQVGC